MRNKEVGKRLVRFIYMAGIRSCRFSDIQRYYVENILNKNYDEKLLVRNWVTGRMMYVRRYRSYGTAFFQYNNIISRCCIKNDLGMWIYAKDV